MQQNSASGWSLVQRSLAACGVSECDPEALIMKRPWPSRGCCVLRKKYATEVYHYTQTFPSGYERSPISDNFDKIDGIGRRQMIYRIPDTINTFAELFKVMRPLHWWRLKSITQRRGTEDSSSISNWYVLLDSNRTGGQKRCINASQSSGTITSTLRL